MRWRLRDLGDSVGQDAADLKQLQAQGSLGLRPPSDPRPLAVLSYRVAVAQQLQLTERALSNLLED